MVTVKGPALGLSPQNYTRLVGRIADALIEEDEPFLDRDLGVKISLDTEHIAADGLRFHGAFPRFRGNAGL